LPFLAKLIFSGTPQKLRIIVKSMVLGFFMLADTFSIPFVSKKQSRKHINNNFQICLYFHFRKVFFIFFSNQFWLVPNSSWRQRKLLFRRR